MSPRDISSRWDNTPMRDYSTWNLKIVPFVFRVYQRVFIYIVDLYTLRYLSKHSVIKIDPGDIHLKLLYLTTVFLSTMFLQGRSFLFIAKWLWVFFPSGIHAPWRFSDVDVVTSDTFNFVCHTFCIAHAFPSVLHTWQSSRSHCRGLNGWDFWSNLLIATPAFSTTLIVKPCRFISVRYFFCSCEFGVAGTKITASFPPRFYQPDFFPNFSCSRSPFLHSLGRCNGLSPSWSAFFLVLYALRAESTASYLNFLL